MLRAGTSRVIGATRHQVATASCDRYRSRGPVVQWAALPGDRAGAKLPEPATVSRRPATGIVKRFSLRQSARVGYVETRPSMWQAGHVTNFGSSSSNQE